MVDIAQRAYTEHMLNKGQGAWEVAFSSAGDLAFVSNEFLPPPGLGRDSISFFGTSSLSELLAAPVLSAPIGIAVLGSGKLVFVTSSGSDAVSVVDAESGQMVGSIPVGSRPWGIALKGQQLVVTKSDWQDPSPVGWANYYEITVRNNSGRTLHDVMLYDTLPDGIQFISTMETGGAYSQATRQVIWEMGDLGAATEKVVRLRFRSTSGVDPGASVLNEAIATCLEGVVGYDAEQTSFSAPPIATETQTLAPTATGTSLPSPTVSLTPSSTATEQPSVTATTTLGPTTWTPTATATFSVTGTITATATGTVPPTATEAPEAGSIQVFTWYDLDGDGRADAGEPPLPDVNFLASGMGEDISGVTDAQGLAVLGGLAPGDYMVRSDEVPGLVRTTSRTVKLTVSSLMTSEAAFGFRALPQHLPLILSTE